MRARATRVNRANRVNKTNKVNRGNKAIKASRGKRGVERAMRCPARVCCRRWPRSTLSLCVSYLFSRLSRLSESQLRNTSRVSGVLTCGRRARRAALSRGRRGLHRRRRRASASPSKLLTPIEGRSLGDTPQVPVPFALFCIKRAPPPLWISSSIPLIFLFPSFFSRVKSYVSLKKKNNRFSSALNLHSCNNRDENTYV